MIHTFCIAQDMYILSENITAMYEIAINSDAHKFPKVPICCQNNNIIQMFRKVKQKLS